MVIWFLKKYFGFTIPVAFENAELEENKFTFNKFPIYANGDEITDEILLIKGLCYIFFKILDHNEVNQLKESFETNRAEINFVFSLKPDLRLEKIASKMQVKYFSYSDITKYLYPSETSILTEGILFDIDQISGFLIVEDTRFSKRIRESREGFKYYLLNGLGNYLAFDKSNVSYTKHIVFYSPNSVEHGRNGEIWGIAELSELREVGYKDCLNDFSNKSQELGSITPIFSKEEFILHFEERWESSGNEKVVVLTVENLTLLQNPLNPNDVVSENLSKVINSDLQNGGLMNMYLDKETVAIIYNTSVKNELSQSFPFPEMPKLGLIKEEVQDIIQINNGEIESIKESEKLLKKIQWFITNDKVEVAFELGNSLFEGRKEIQNT